MIQHFKTCHADYPEKPAGEAPQHTQDDDLEDGTIARICTDCGAFEIIKKEVEA